MNEGIRKLEKLAHHLILDIGTPMNLTCLENIIEAMKDIFGLLCSITDPTYNTIVSISIINKQHQMLLKMTPTFGNFSKFMKTVNEIRNMAKANEQPKDENEFNDYLLVAFNTVLEDLKSQSKILNLWDEFYNIDICLVTQKSGLAIKEFLDSLLTNPHLKESMVLEIEKICDDSGTSECTGNFFKLANAKEDIETFLKMWLLKRIYNKEHLHLVLPNDILLCDLRENILSPLLVIFGHKYFVESRFSVHSVHLSNTNPTDITSLESEIHQFKVVARIPSSGLCESHIFGEPLEIIPTSHCQQGYESSYSLNQQKFFTLCAVLIEKEECLIVKMEGNPPNGFFALEPGYDTLLLKSLIPRELLLTYNDTNEHLILSNSIRNIIEQSLNHVEFKEGYDPSQQDSGLYLALQDNFSKPKGKLITSSSKMSGTMTNWVTVSHPALEGKVTKVKSKPRKRKPSTFNLVQYKK